MRNPKNPKHLFGLMAEFASPEALEEAAKKARKKGYTAMEAYSPFPIEGLSEIMGLKHTKLPLIVLIGGILGGLAGFFMQYYASVVAYPYNIGGRPFNSWPSFIPITFEMIILGAAASAVFGMLALNGLPRPYHPVFHVDRFEAATKDKFFLCIWARDKKFDAGETKEFLRELEPVAIEEVEP